jgi:glycosyltransferase involved in cell wall biosynthesis
MDLPLVMIEAMLLGRATLVAADTAAAELAEGDAALTAPATDEATTDALAHLLRDPALRARMGATARAAALERHDPRAIAARHDALYDELLP